MNPQPDQSKKRGEETMEQVTKDINIEYKQYRLPFKIVIDGVKYPNNQHNWDVIAEYNKTKNEKVLEKLTTFSLVF